MQVLIHGRLLEVTGVDIATRADAFPLRYAGVCVHEMFTEEVSPPGLDGFPPDPFCETVSLIGFGHGHAGVVQQCCGDVNVECQGFEEAAGPPGVGAGVVYDQGDTERFLVV